MSGDPGALDQERGGICESIEAKPARELWGSRQAAKNCVKNAAYLEKAKLVMNKVWGRRMSFSATAACTSGGEAETSEVK